MSGKKQKQGAINGHVVNKGSSQIHDPQEIVLTSADGNMPATGHGSSRDGESGSGLTPAVNSGGGFNIAEHLQKNVDLERTDGSLSPEINQFLQDISSVVRSLSPDNNNRLEEKEHSARDKPDPQIRVSPRHKSRLKIAANFGTVSVKPEEVKLVGDSSPHSPDPTDLNPDVAAAKIQQWYRQKRRVRAAQVQSLLANKRDELNRSRTEEQRRIRQEFETREQKERERQKRRAAKMQAARKVAIEDLKRKREEKRERTERIAQEEIVSESVCIDPSML